MQRLFLTLAALMAAAPAWSHPGHAEAERLGFLHWLVMPDHLALLVTIAAALAGAAVWRGRAGRD